MLVLTRRVNEKIRIGDDVLITITKCNKNRAVVAIQAPSSVLVSRPESEARHRNSKEPEQGRKLAAKML